MDQQGAPPGGHMDVTVHRDRVDADEVTYSLHIILRFELEQEIFAGNIELKDLPDEWNRRFEEYLGIPVPSDTKNTVRS